MGFLGIGFIVGTITALVYFLAAMLPYAVLASALTDKDKNK